MNLFSETALQPGDQFGQIFGCIEGSSVARLNDPPRQLLAIPFLSLGCKYFLKSLDRKIL